MQIKRANDDNVYRADMEPSVRVDVDAQANADWEIPVEDDGREPARPVKTQAAAPATTQLRRKTGTVSNKTFWITAIICGVVIAICGGWIMPVANGPVIFWDELGYWGNAAILSGRDWFDALSTCPLYAFGYSLLLVPLFWLGLPMAVMYKIGIAMNVVFLLLSFMFTYRCMRKLFAALVPVPALVVSAAATLYTNNLIQAQAAWDETLLYLIYWGLFYILLCLIEKASNVLVIMLALCTGYMYMVHMRSIAVIIAVVMTVMLLFVAKKLDLKQVLIFVFVLAGMLAVQTLVKNWTVDNIYTNQDLRSKNDYSGQFSSFFGAFTTLDGWERMGYSLAGKLYYLGGATLLFGFVGLKRYVVDGFAALGNLVSGRFRSFDARKIPIAFLLLSFAGTFAINVINMRWVEIPTYILYGRYMEFVFGPLIAIGLSLVLLGRVGLGEALGTSGVMVLCTLILNNVVNTAIGNGVPDLNPVNVSALRTLFNACRGGRNVLCYMALIIISVFWIIWAMQFFATRYVVVTGAPARRIKLFRVLRPLLRVLLPALTAAGVWIWFMCGSAYFSTTQRNMSAQFEQTMTLIEQRGETPKTIYWVQGDNEWTDPVYIQMRMDKTTLKAISAAEFLHMDLDPEALYVVACLNATEDGVAKTVRERCVKATHNLYFAVYTVPQSKWYEAFSTMPMLVSTMDEVEIVYGGGAKMTANKYSNDGTGSGVHKVKAGTQQNDDGTYSTVVEPNVTSGKATGTVVEGPGMELTPGKYRLDFVLTLDEKTTESSLGEIELHDGYGNVISSIELKADDFELNTPTQIGTTISTMLDQNMSGLNFTWHGEKDIEMTLKKVIYTRTGDATEVISADTAEIDAMGRLLELDYEKHPLYVLPYESQIGRASIADLQAAFPDRDVLIGNLSALREQPGILLIPTDRSKQVYTLLGEYTIAERIGNYTVMLPSNSTAYSEFVGHGGIPMSEGYSVQMRYYSDNDTQMLGVVKATPAAGTYQLLVRPAFSNLLTGHYGHFTLTVGGKLIATTELDRGEERDAGFYMPFNITLDGTEEVAVTISTDTNVILSDMNVTLRELGDIPFTYGDIVG